MYNSCFYSAQGELTCNRQPSRSFGMEHFSQNENVTISKADLKPNYVGAQKFFDRELKNCKLENDQVLCQMVTQAAKAAVPAGATRCRRNSYTKLSKCDVGGAACTKDSDCPTTGGSPAVPEQLTAHKAIVPKGCEYCKESYNTAIFKRPDGSIEHVPSISCKCGNDTYPGLLNYANSLDYNPNTKAYSPKFDVAKTNPVQPYEGNVQMDKCFKELNGIVINDSKRFRDPAKPKDNAAYVNFKGILC